MARRQKPSTSPWLIVGIICGVLFLIGLSCFGGVLWFVFSFSKPTSFGEESQSYEQARATYQTKLTTRGPSPQSSDPLVRPPGVNELPYRSGDLNLKAWVSAPTGNGLRKPAVVFLHGGFAFGDDDWEQAEPFQRAGYVVMMPILRGENGQPGHYSMFYDEVNDVLAATDALTKLPYVDSSKLYICGHSVGGTMTMLTILTSDKFRAAASFSGSTDQKLWSSGQLDLCPFNTSDPNEFRMRSPLAFPKSVKCPLRIYYGSQEFLFKGMSQEMAKKSKAAGKDVEAMSVPGDHGSMLDTAIPKAIQFFQSK